MVRFSNLKDSFLLADESQDVVDRLRLVLGQLLPAVRLLHLVEVLHDALDGGRLQAAPVHHEALEVEDRSFFAVRLHPPFHAVLAEEHESAKVVFESRSVQLHDAGRRVGERTQGRDVAVNEGDHLLDGLG